MNPNDFGQPGQPTDQTSQPEWPATPAPTPQPIATPPTTPEYAAPAPAAAAPLPPEVPLPQTATPPAPPLPTPPGKHDHPMVVLQPGERIIAQIKRHPIGLIGNYISGGFVVLIAAAIAVFGVPHLTQTASNPSQIQAIAYAVLLLLAVGAAGMLAIASRVYWQNEWVVTTDSITQITQLGLFTRQTAQLSMENLEDVTVDQDGLVQHTFGFGTLHVETAGEHSKFVFPYCPNPTQYARLILEARENFVNHKQYEGN